jgi:hypothetical protein
VDDDYSIGLRDHFAAIKIWLPKTEGMTGSMHKVYLPLLLLLILWIGSTTITTGNKKAHRFAKVSRLRLTN